MNTEPLVKFQVITLFPEMIQAVCENGVLGQACKKGLVQVLTIHPRDFTSDVHKTVDDRPFGGGDGMILLYLPLKKALERALEAVLPESAEKAHVIYLSPQGSLLNQAKVVELSKRRNLILLCGRYGGVDQRVINQFVDEEISVGDYILSGGELAAGVLIDAVSRQIPGVLGHENSALTDSLSGALHSRLEAPSWTRPREIAAQETPKILLSGNHSKIEHWKLQVSWLVTLLKRPDLIAVSKKSENFFGPKERKELRIFWQELSNSEKAVLGLGALSNETVESLISDDSI